MKRFIYGLLCIITLIFTIAFILNAFFGIEFKGEINNIFRGLNSTVSRITRSDVIGEPKSDDEFVSQNRKGLSEYKGTQNSPIPLFSDDSEIYSEMIKAVENGETKFFLRDRSSSFEVIKERVEELRYYYPSVQSLIYPTITGVIQSGYRVDNGLIMLYLSSSMGESKGNKDYIKLCEYVRDDLEKMFADGKLKNSMTDKEKSLVIARHIVENTTYDRTVKFGTMPKATSRSHNPLGFYEGWELVCDGYSGLYNVFMWELGIESYMIVSDRHAWNLVKLDDKWYHTDVTYADPVLRDRNGKYLENNECREEYINTTYTFLKGIDKSSRVLREDCLDIIRNYLGFDM